MSSTCPYCRSSLAGSERATTCSHCGLSYHQECWRENGGCAAYGCQGSARAPLPGEARERPVVVTLGDGDFPSEAPWPLPATYPPPPSRSLLSACGEVGSGLGALIGAIMGGLAGAQGGAAGLIAGAVLGIVAGLLVGYFLVPLALIAGGALLAAVVFGLPLESALVIGLLVGGLAVAVLSAARVPGRPFSP